MAPPHVCGNGHWMGSLDTIVNVFKNCKKTLDCKKKTSTSPNSRERSLIMKTGWGTEREGKREGIVQCFMKTKDKSLLDVENVETTGVAMWADEHYWTVHCVCSAEWSSFHLHLGISYQCIWGWQHCKHITHARGAYTHAHQMSFHPFFFRSGAPLITLLTARVLPYLQLPATASNVPPQTKIPAAPVRFTHK